MRLNIIPVPKQSIIYDKCISLKGPVKITGVPDPFNMEYLINAIHRYTGLTVTGMEAQADITVVFTYEKSMAEEAYSLAVAEDSITIGSRDRKGQFYAIITLLQLLSQGDSLTCLEITDEPRYACRSFLLDVCRHFIPKDELLRLIEIAALHKLNRLHLHLTDDQGWRIEIEQYPGLTQIGAVRRDSPSADYKEETSEYKNNGYYTKADIREILQYASERNIEVVPEIDLPGHMTAAAAAYPEILCHPHPVEVAGRPGIYGDVLCMGREENYAFVFHILKEIFELFPGEYIHLGGDEVLKTNWITCERCLEVVRRNKLKTPNEMQSYFTNRILSFAEENGKKIILWNEAFADPTLAKSTICEYWNVMDKPQRLQEILKARGTKIIDANMKAYYFDYPIGATSLKTAYEYQSIFEGADYRLQGLEMALWAETVHTKTILNERLFPRMSAFAEAAWSPEKKKDYVLFRQRLLQNEKLFSDYGIVLTNEKQWEASGIKAKLEFLKHMKRLLPKGMLKSVLQMHRINKMKFNS